MLSKNNLSHGYAIYGVAEIVQKEIIKFVVNELKVDITNNPDFFHEKFETLTIDDSRRIKEIALGRRFSSDKPRIFILELYAATREAQNALLKLFEEPESGNHFFIVAPYQEILLPTLRSRLQEIYEKGDIVSLVQLSEFIKKSLGEKINYVDTLASNISDGKMPKHEALEFLNGLEHFLYKKDKKDKLVVFHALNQVRPYINDRAPSIKILLEYIALVIPQGLTD